MTSAAKVLTDIADAAARTIIDKLIATGMTIEQAEAYVKAHEAEVAAFAVRLIAAHHLSK